ncbi:hypothetical protein [Kordia sp.]|uniref:hypothetical protein n=1 Tax=Kordia sp. TaxID=1965332 RepID=UPI0025BF8F54|nr:hypothetical protein [Kordia sp.]MCH2195124.1 hypothetical protein [Kordia sp.]
MKLVKIGLLIFTIIITVLLFVFSYVMYLDLRSFQGAVSALFFLACTSSFSIYFHIKTLRYYPLFIFGKTIEELTKQYWALHISFGLINLLLGFGILIPKIINGTFVMYSFSAILSICFIVFGFVTLLETYKLNRFVTIYKRRREQHEEIENIKGVNES